MDRQRDRFSRALFRIVWSLDCPEQLAAYLRELGRDHRGFGVASRHHPGFMDALLAALREVAGPAWSGEVAAAWEAVLAMVSRVMIEATGEDARRTPSWWLAEVVPRPLGKLIEDQRPGEAGPAETQSYAGESPLRYPPKKAKIRRHESLASSGS